MRLTLFAACVLLAACGPAFTTGEGSDLATDAASKPSQIPSSTSPTDATSSTDAPSLPGAGEASVPSMPSSGPDGGSSDALATDASVPDVGACVAISGFICPGGGFVYKASCDGAVVCCNWPATVCP